MADEIDQSAEEQELFHNLNIQAALASSPGMRYKSDDGICISCGEDIPEARLKALPGTGLCVDCANEKEEAAKKIC